MTSSTCVCYMNLRLLEAPREVYVFLEHFLVLLCSTVCSVWFITLYIWVMHVPVRCTAGCVVPVSPVNGDWQTFSPSTTVGPGTSLSLSCSPGSVPSEVMSSTCQSDGSWDPDTAELECVTGVLDKTKPKVTASIISATVDCGSPTIASGVVLEPSSPNTTLNSTFLFRCAEGLFPNTTHEAVCGDDSQWRPDPANHNCGDEDAGVSYGVGVLQLTLILSP